jgi:hypothetical protein
LSRKGEHERPIPLDLDDLNPFDILPLQIAMLTGLALPETTTARHCRAVVVSGSRLF